MGDMLLIGIVVLGSFLFASFLLRIEFAGSENLGGFSLLGAGIGAGDAMAYNTLPRVAEMQNKRKEPTEKIGLSKQPKTLFDKSKAEEQSEVRKRSIMNVEKKKEIKNITEVPTRYRNSSGKLVRISNRDYKIVMSQGHTMELNLHLN